MKKLPLTLLILSLAANAALLLGVAAGLFTLGKPPAANTRATVKRAPAPNTLSPAAATAATALLSTDDPAALRDRLRELGLSEDVVRAIVKGNIKSRHAARLREIDAAALEAFQKTPYWRPMPAHTDFDSIIFSFSGYTAEQAKERRAIAREEQEQIRQVLGDDNGITEDNLFYSTFLPPDKAARLAGIESDYDDLRRDVRDGMAGFEMPGDKEKLKLLNAEQQRDTLALLTPDEQAAKKLRDSFTAFHVQLSFEAFDGTEDEYKALFALREAGGDEKEIKELLGDERYAEYQLAQRRDYKSLVAAAQRFNLPQETIAQTYQARESAFAAVKRISADTTLDTQQKTQAYTALADQATAQIRAALGDNIGDAYIDNALPWLKLLPNGGTVKVGSQDVIVMPPKPETNGE